VVLVQGKKIIIFEYFFHLFFMEIIGICIIIWLRCYGKEKYWKNNIWDPIDFFFFIVISIPVIAVLYMILPYIIMYWLGIELLSYSHQCAVGFSGVLFAMKVVLNYNSEGYTQYWGLNIPMKYLAWFELLLIQIVTPNASLLGHLCGILMGLLYMWGVFNFIFKYAFFI